MSVDLGELKQRQRQMWASGDFPSVAKRIASVGEDVVEAAEIEPGMEVLDVAAGAGNAAIPAAREGGKVIASDLTPELFDAGRRTAAQAGVELEWVEADAEDLPFDEGRFDRVLSTFGAMFAPRHDRTASELSRVTKPGGRIVMANWTPEGAVGRMFATIGSYVPPAPGVDAPPVLWGTEGHVRELLEPHGVQLSFERRMCRLYDESPGSYIDFLGSVFGPMMGAKAMLEAEGRWDQLRQELVELFESFAVDDDTAPFVADMEWLLVRGEKAG
jgi:SAM-dependent methyltransferase